MATCTREQLKRWNSKLANGFVLDLMYFLNWGEKKAVKDIDLGGGQTLRASLEYHEKREKPFARECRYQPALHVAIYTDRGGSMMCSYGMGASVDIGTIQDKRKYDVLCKLSATLDDEKIKDVAKANAGKLNNPFII